MPPPLTTFSAQPACQPTAQSRIMRALAPAFLPHREELGRVAQLVEQGIENPCVGGSIPSPATMNFAPRWFRPSRGFFVLGCS